jgi:hypothetical protein
MDNLTLVTESWLTWHLWIPSCSTYNRQGQYQTPRPTFQSISWACVSWEQLLLLELLSGFFFFFCFETGSHYGAQDVLKLAMYPRLASNSILLHGLRLQVTTPSSLSSFFNAVLLKTHIGKGVKTDTMENELLRHWSKWTEWPGRTVANQATTTTVHTDPLFASSRCEFSRLH